MDLTILSCIRKCNDWRCLLYSVRLISWMWWLIAVSRSVPAFRLNDFRYQRKSIIKEDQVWVLLVVSVNPLHLQSDNNIQHGNTVGNWVFIYLGCHSLSFASHLTSKLMDIAVCPIHQVSPFWHPSSELSSVLSWTHMFDWLVGQAHLYTPWKGGRWACSVILSSFSSSFVRVFYSYLWFIVKY
jgi:hypothetical protein